MTFKSTYEKGQIWLEKLKAKQLIKYGKLKPRILSRGAMTFTTIATDGNAKDENLENYLLVKRRMHSIDVGELQNNLAKLSVEKAELRRGSLLTESSNELMVIHTLPHNNACKRWTKCKRAKVMVKSIENDRDDVMVVPTFLLTYNPKFSKISNDTYRSFSAIHLNEICDDSEA